MLFNSGAFIAFFVVVYGVYLCLGHRAQNIWLLLASYFFYSCWDWRFTGLLLFSTGLDFGLSHALYRADGPKRKKAILLVSLITNLSILFFFKYFNFFYESTRRLLAPLHLPTEFISVVLPIGISFYTFHNLSYIIDIYRGRAAPAKKLVDFALFVAFFPQLVAGPIARAGHLLPQVETERHIRYRAVRDGFWLILLGYFKKVVVADNLAHFSAPLFADPRSAHGTAVLFALYCFTFQIYGDFSGYSDIARGVSKWMGFELMLNFNRPYFALNPSDFWARWHISLSTWLRDYLYIPLGGNRGSQFLTLRNLLITMVIGGLWHGAAWHFVAWGAYHGLLLVAQRLLSPLVQRTHFNERIEAVVGRNVWKTVRVIGFFHLICLGLLIFAAHSLRDVGIVLYQLFHPLRLTGTMPLITLAVFVGPLIFLEWLEERYANRLTFAGETPSSIAPPVAPLAVALHSSAREPEMLIKTWPRPVRLLCYSLIFTYIVLSGVVERHEFIYFQF